MPHHITQRGNHRLPTFFCDEDYQTYLSLLSEFCAQYHVDIWAHCLMPNHVHLILVPADEFGLRDALGEAIANTGVGSISGRDGVGIFGRSAFIRL